MTTTTKGHEPSPSPILSAYSAWCAARHDVQAGIDIAGAEDEEANRLLNVKRDAAWQLVRAPVRSKQDWPTLALAVQEIFSEADLVGTPTDRVHRAILNKLLGEVISDGEDVAS